LYSLGGLAVGSNALSSRWQRIAVSFAGPLAGFLFLGVVAAGVWALCPPGWFEALVSTGKWLVGLGRPLPWPEQSLLSEAVYDLLFINLLWGLVNLLPIWPLDGGQISRDLCKWVSRDKGVQASLVISAVVAALIAINSLTAVLNGGTRLIPFLYAGGRFAALFFGLFALGSVAELVQTRTSNRTWPGERHASWERDPDYWKRGRDDSW
jgi:Zn-dependent protease